MMLKAYINNRTIVTFILASIFYLLLYLCINPSKWDFYSPTNNNNNNSCCAQEPLISRRHSKIKDDKKLLKNCSQHDSQPGPRLFYNRVPKCGSTTLYTLLKKLSKRNGFKHFNSKVYDKRILTFEEQSSLIETVMNSPSPCSFDRHVFYIDFEKHQVSNGPTFINLIRDPVERIISSYFYRRVVAKRQIDNNRTQRPKPSDYWLKKKFKTCVLNRDPECTFIEGQSYSTLLVPYFCGQDKRCLTLNDAWALHEAKRNVEASYSVIGSLEHMDITLNVLQDKLPQFFAGCRDLYYTDMKETNRKNQNHNKENVTLGIKQLLKNNLTNEYEFYHFALQRLFKQFYQIKNVKN